MFTLKMKFGNITLLLIYEYLLESSHKIYYITSTFETFNIIFICMIFRYAYFLIISVLLFKIFKIIYNYIYEEKIYIRRNILYS